MLFWEGFNFEKKGREKITEDFSAEKKGNVVVYYYSISIFMCDIFSILSAIYNVLVTEERLHAEDTSPPKRLHKKKEAGQNIVIPDDLVSFLSISFFWCFLKIL